MKKETSIRENMKAYIATPCEAFWTETQVTDNKCPDCGRPVEEAQESAYFFKLSKYQDKRIESFENNLNFAA